MQQPLIVLKFGGSVLSDEGTLPRVVHEIHRWRRQGHAVVAVVSALAGVTDALLRQARARSDKPAPEAVAALVAGGELQSAALLGLALDAAGLPARVLSPAALGLVAEGDPLDATPVGVQTRQLRRALRAGDVVVVPGFVAQSRDGRVVLLGRGGSDLTALLLAAQLRAERCRLVKDVDGLYERDPALPGPPPHRYATASWDAALALDGRIIQHKGLRFARAQQLAFELACWNGSRPTRIGPEPTRLDGGPRSPRRRLSVALLGLGTVGSAVWQRLRELPELFEVTAVAVRDPGRARAASPPAALLSGDAVAVAACGADLVVEALGGLEPSRSAIEAALRAGSHVVTANKAVLAAHGEELQALARACGVSLSWSAAAGAAVPVLAAVTRAARRAPLQRVDAVLNGTSNVVLDALADGVSWERALQDAQQAGFAERGAERDLSGRDAADKLVLLLHAATGRWCDAADVACTPLTPATLAAAARPGCSVRQVASLAWRNGAWIARVEPLALPPGHALHAVRCEGNAAVLRTRAGTHFVHGKGAGGGPTATAVLGDLLALVRREAGHDLHRAIGERRAAWPMEAARRPPGIRGSRARRCAAGSQPG